MHVSLVIAIAACVFFFSFVQCGGTLAAAAAALGSLNKNVCEQWQSETDMMAEQNPIKALQFSLQKSSSSVQRIHTHTHTHTNLPIGWASKSRLVLLISNICQWPGRSQLPYTS